MFFVGWSTEPGRDSTLEYRLSIINAVHEDSGRYTCITPIKHRHSVDIEVKCKSRIPLHACNALITHCCNVREIKSKIFAFVTKCFLLFSLNVCSGALSSAQRVQRAEHQQSEHQDERQSDLHLQ